MEGRRLTPTVEGNTTVQGLLPCPFCGTPNPVIIREGEWLIGIYCTNVDCMAVIWDEDVQDAIRLWNRRVEE